jgi:hypothetical protein
MDGTAGRLVWYEADEKNRRGWTARLFITFVENVAKEVPNDRTPRI